MVRVPENASGGALQVVRSDHESQPFPVSVAFQIADNLHPVSNPAVDPSGNIYVTFSGPRGQRVPVSLYKISSNYTVKPFVTSLINPTGLALDRNGNLFVSCRHDGTIYRVPPDGRAEQWMEGMGTATGIAFDGHGNLFVGDRSGTIFKISPPIVRFLCSPRWNRRCPPTTWRSIPTAILYVTGPTTSSYDRVYRITPGGEVHVFFRGLGGRRAWRLIESPIFIWRRRWRAAVGLCELTRRAARSMCSVGRRWLGWRYFLPVARSWRPTVLCSLSIGTLAACHFWANVRNAPLQIAWKVATSR